MRYDEKSVSVPLTNQPYYVMLLLLPYINQD